MKNRKDFSISVSMGILSNHAGQSYLINQPSRPIDKANRSSSNISNRRKEILSQVISSSSRNTKYPNEDESTNFSQHHRQNKKTTSQSISKTKQAIDEELSVRKKEQNCFGKPEIYKENKATCNEPKITGIPGSELKLQNRNCSDSKITVPTHRKLYTFCNQNRAFQITNTHSQRHQEKGTVSGEFSLPDSTIMVKEEQLKRFTHKFARQKIEYEQLISNLQLQLMTLKSSIRGLGEQNNCLLRTLESQEEELDSLRFQISEFHEKYQLAKKLLEQKNEQLAGLLSMMREKEQKILSLYSEGEERQRQSERLERQDQQTNLFLPLSNINHARSINTSVSSESTPTISKQILEEIEGIRQEKNHIQKEYQIENEHTRRQLDIEKQLNLELKQEIKQLENKLRSGWNVNQRRGDTLQHRISQLRAEIEKLANQNAELAHHKQTLQRSLKVSSEMIVCLKRENSELKYGQREDLHRMDVMPIEDVRAIILSMMKEQLQLEERYKKPDESLKPIPNMLSSTLQKKYEEGYQSITRKARGQHSKTENFDGNSPHSSGKKRVYTQAESIGEFNNENWEPSQEIGRVLG